MPEAEVHSPIIEVQSVSAVFPTESGDLHALKNVSFNVQEQEFICILGPSGSGKSTLLRMLAGLLPPTKGKISMDGEPVNGPRQGIGFVFQKANLMPWRTVQENILLPLELLNVPHSEAVQRAQDMVELVGLGGFENTLPRDLSGGMAQRVAIARALIQDPRVMLLDEPFGQLDALTRERMGEELLNIWQKRRKTVLMVTHSLTESLYLADRVLVLSQRPGQFNLDLPVTLPRPREDAMRYTPEFGDMVRQLRSAIGIID